MLGPARPDAISISKGTAGCRVGSVGHTNGNVMVQAQNANFAICNLTFETTN